MRIFLIAGVAALALASCDEIQINKDTSGQATAALKASKDRLEADVRYLSDDLLEGREAGKRGFDLAANYVAARYRSLGLKPAGDDGSYFQSVPMAGFAPDPAFDNTLTLSGNGAPNVGEPYKDYAAGGLGVDGAAEGDLVFVGYGLVAPDYNRDDYEGLDVEGKIAVALWGAPKFLNTEERAHYRATTALRASEHGAIGIIFLATPTLQSLAPFDLIMQMQRHESQVTWLEADGTPHNEAPNLQAFAILGPELCAKVFENQPVSWDDLVAVDESEEGDVKGFDMGMRARIAFKSLAENINSKNVIGLLPGTDAKLKNEYVVLTGHLDHEGIIETPEEGDDEIYNGAMDNAVGTSSMLEVARLLAKNPPKRSVLFIALTAEEKGLIGSDYNANNSTVPADQIVANVNLDMPIMTYQFTDIVAFGAERSSLYGVVEAAATANDLVLSPDPQPDQGLFVRSDQYSYVKKGVPAIFLKPGWANGGEEAQNKFREENYHKPSDEADLIDFEQLRRFSQVNYEIAKGIANMQTRPLWNKGDFFARIFDGPMAE